jgi:hypothetical protein
MGIVEESEESLGEKLTEAVKFHHVTELDR